MNLSFIFIFILFNGIARPGSIYRYLLVEGFYGFYELISKINPIFN